MPFSEQCTHGGVGDDEEGIAMHLKICREFCAVVKYLDTDCRSSRGLVWVVGLFTVPRWLGMRLRHSNAACEDQWPALTCTRVRY